MQAVGHLDIFSTEVPGIKYSFDPLVNKIAGAVFQAAFPTTEEVEARRKQMQIIVDKIHAIRDRCVVVTGDLNLDDNEYNASSWHTYFQKGDCETIQRDMGWG